MEKIDLTQFYPCEEGLDYYNRKSSFEEAWRDCERGAWMLWIATKLGVDDRILTRAKALCANTVRHLMKDERSTEVVDAALRYAAGEISRDELDKYAAAAYFDYANNKVAYSAAANDASFTAYAARDAAYAAYVAVAYAAVDTAAANAAAVIVAARAAANAIRATDAYAAALCC